MIYREAFNPRQPVSYYVQTFELNDRSVHEKLEQATVLLWVAAEAASSSEFDLMHEIFGEYFHVYG